MIAANLTNVNSLSDLTSNDRIIHEYDKRGLFYRDVNTFIDVLKRNRSGLMTDDDALLNMVMILARGVSYHKTGKIAGSCSIDSCTECKFCQKMIEYAHAHPEQNIICGYCYANAGSKYKTAALARHFLNMTILSNVVIDKYIELLPLQTLIIRFNSDGDIVNQLHAENLIRIASYPMNKNKNFALWAKNVAPVEKAFNKLGKPENMRFVQSVCQINGTCAPSRYADSVFLVATGETIPSYLAAGCNECNGKKCGACGWKCYLKESDGGWKNGTLTVEKLRNVGGK